MNGSVQNLAVARVDAVLKNALHFWSLLRSSSALSVFSEERSPPEGVLIGPTPPAVVPLHY